MLGIKNVYAVQTKKGKLTIDEKKEIIKEARNFFNLSFEYAKRLK